MRDDYGTVGGGPVVTISSTPKEFRIEMPPENVLIMGTSLTQVIRNEAGFATWEQRYVDMALGAGFGSFFATLVLVVIAHSVLTPKYQRSIGPTEPVR